MDNLNRCFTPQDLPHVITLFATDAVDMEPFIQATANKASLANPDHFSGERPAVYFSVPYTAPYERESFDFLKYLAVTMRNAAGMRAGYYFRGTICLEVTAWLGHLDEELFQVFLKYLYDCYPECALVICANFNHPREFRTLEQICLCIGFATDTLTLYLESQSNLSLILDTCFERRRVKLLGTGRELLVSSLHKHISVIPKRIKLLDRVADDLCRLAHNPGKDTFVQAKHVAKYLADPNSTLCRITGQPLLERRNLYELQL